VDFERKGIQNIYRSGFNQPLFTPDEERHLNGDSIYYNPEAQEPDENKQELMD
jgi:hypothetical protein